MSAIRVGNMKLLMNVPNLAWYKPPELMQGIEQPPELMPAIKQDTGVSARSYHT